MTDDNNVVEGEVLPPVAKPSFRDRFKRNNTESTNANPKSKPIKSRLKDAAAVIGVVTVAGVVAGAVANRKSKTVVIDTEDVIDTETPSEDN